MGTGEEEDEAELTTADGDADEDADEDEEGDGDTNVGAACEDSKLVAAEVSSESALKASDVALTVVYV